MARLPADDLQDWFRHWDVVLPPAASARHQSYPGFAEEQALLDSCRSQLFCVCAGGPVYVDFQEPLHRKTGTSESIVPPRRQAGGWES